MTFWNTLFEKGPVVGMSPMDGVTDAPMRYMTAKCGQPDVIFTEFVSTDGLTHAKNPDSVGRLMSAFIRARDVGPLEHLPYEVAQVFGHDPEYFYSAAVIIAALGYDGMDINMGCPAPNVQEHGSGAGLIRTPNIAQEIVRAAKQGMKDWAEGKTSLAELPISDAVKEWTLSHADDTAERAELPVSVKTRLGVDSIVVEDWMNTLMDVEPAVISLHGRTLKQLYQGSADWDAIGRAAEVVHSRGGHLLGNGDVQSLTDGMEKVREYGVDGFLIGRAAEGNPSIFAGVTEPSWEMRRTWISEHSHLYERIFGAEHFIPMRKHLAWYCKGFPGASDVRQRFVRAGNAQEVSHILESL